MPTYIDRHRFAAVPSTVRRQLQLEAAHGLADEHGAQPLAHWFTDGVIYCVVQAPDQAAFCRHHAHHGLPCEDVHPIAGLGGSHPLSVEGTRLMDAALAELWPADA
jgi:hypothetical protein